MNKVGLLYSSFIALYQEAPKGATGSFSDKGIWEHYHSLIDQLNQATGLDFNDCKILVSSANHNNRTHWYANPREYCSKLNDLISRLHTQFFNSEPHPTAPQQVPLLQQTISNKAEANVYLSLMLQLNNQLHSAKEQAKTDDEKRFIDTLIQKVGKVKSYIEFLILVANTAKQFGIGLDRIVTLFGGS